MGTYRQYCPIGRLGCEVAVTGCTLSNMKATLIGGVAAPLGSARPTRRESLADSFTLGAASGTRAPDGLVLTSPTTRGSRCDGHRTIQGYGPHP